MTEDFFEGLPVNFILTTSRSFAQLARQNATVYFHPDCHFDKRIGRKLLENEKAPKVGEARHLPMPGLSYPTDQFNDLLLRLP